MGGSYSIGKERTRQKRRGRRQEIDRQTDRQTDKVKKACSVTVCRIALS